MRNNLLIIILLALSACNHISNKSNKAYSTDSTTAKHIIDTIRILSEVAKDTTHHPRFIVSGKCADGSITAADTKYKWKGFFYNKELWYIADTKVSVNLLSQTINETNPNGDVLVKTTNKDQDILLVADQTDLINGPVKQIETAMTHILPGEEIKFTYNNKNFTLYATGHVVKIDPSKKADIDNISNIENYNLYIKGAAKGHYFEQLLVHNNFYESGFATEIYLAGDVDGDKLPDFIINTSNYGIGEAPTLFLSKSAGPKNLLISVGGYDTAD